MNEQEWMNEGIDAEARRLGVNVYQAMPDHRAALEAANKSHLARCAPPVEETQIQPYQSPGHAAFDLAVAIAKPAVVLSVAAGAVWVVVATAAAAVGAVMAFISANVLYIGGGLFAVVVVVLGAGSMFGRGGEAQSAGNTAGQGAPIINVTVNVAGQNLSNGTK